MDLYGIVEEYAGLGEHRTGGAVDGATVEWMATQLAELGLDVATEWFEFDHWSAESELSADRRPIDHLAVPYEYTGEIRSQRPETIALDPLFGGFAAVLDEPIRDARAGGADALIAATVHPQGSLVAVNRVPGRGSGFPTVLVAGRDHDRLAGAEIDLHIDARVAPGRSATVVARSRAAARTGAARPLLLTTPLTGWFRCAGERGTGIAVLLELVERLADRPVVVVATTGHELDHLGARQWLPTADLEPDAVVHLGASIGVEEDAPDGTRRLAETRRAMTTLDEAEAAPIAEVLEAARLPLAASSDSWIGEAEVFSALGVPLLSISGAGVDFHTPGDLPERVTSPEAMRRVADAVVEAVHLFDPIRKQHP